MSETTGGATPPSTVSRVASIDTYRGLVMFLMLAEVLRLPAVAKAFPRDPLWQFLGYHQSHVEWADCSLHDLIQPSFTFLVGVSMVFSLAARRARGHSVRAMFGHALLRSFILIALGIFLRSVGRSQTNYTFEDTLTQIGLGYFFLFLLAFRPPRDWLIALALILVGYWALFVFWPLPGSEFDWQAVGVPGDWPHHLSGFAAHWSKNANPAWAFDVWFLNLFPREAPFEYNRGGYATLSFIPTLGTMILGMMAGQLMRSEKTGWSKVGLLTAAGLACLGIGWGLGELGVCPVVKRIWTPSWVLFSGGWCFLILALIASVTDVIGYTLWAFPLIVIGANSIVAYCMENLIAGFVREALMRHLGRDTFLVAGEAYQPLLLGAGVLFVFWLILYWLYRQRIFIRI